MSNDSPRYLIVDGSNYLFRSYFGVPETAIFNGVKVNAVYGFFCNSTACCLICSSRFYHRHF